MLGRALFAISIALTGLGCATPGPPLTVIGGWDLSAWSGCQSYPEPVLFPAESVLIYGCVGPGESVQHGGWTRMFYVHTWGRSPITPTATEFVESRHSERTASCRSYTQEIIRHETSPQGAVEESLYVEWTGIGCPPGIDDFSISRILVGRTRFFEITYVASTQKLASAKRDEWLKELSEATLVPTSP